MARKRKRKSHAYGILLTIYVILLLAAAGYGLTKVWTYAEEYEASRPTNTMDAYMKSLGDNFWGDSMQATIASMEHEVQTDDECAAVVQDMIKNGLTYSQCGGSENEGRIVYNLHCDTGVIGKVTITQNKDNPTEFGLYPWVVSSEEFDFNGLYTSIQVTIPESYSVQLNGHTLGPEYIIESGIHYDVLEEYYDSYSNLPTKCTYKFDHIIGVLEPVIYDSDGNVTTIDKNADDSQFIKSCSDEEKSALSDFTSAFCDAYFHYISGVTNINAGYQALLEYIVEGSDLDTHLLAAQDGLSWAHTSYITIDSFELVDAIKLDTNTYLCYTKSVVTSASTTTETVENDLKLIVNGDLSTGDLKIIGLELY